MRAKAHGQFFFSLKLSPNEGKPKLGKYTFSAGQGSYHAGEQEEQPGAREIHGGKDHGE